MDLTRGSSLPEEDETVFCVYSCSAGHSTAVYVYANVQNKKIVHPGRCSYAVPHVYKEKMDIGFTKVDRPVAVWFGGGNGKLPWMSMLRACDCPFVGLEVVPQDTEISVEFPDSGTTASSKPKVHSKTNGAAMTNGSHLKLETEKSDMQMATI